MIPKKRDFLCYPCGRECSGVALEVHKIALDIVGPRG